MSSKSFQRGTYANQSLTTHCHTHKCERRRDNTCLAILDPALWWARGLCTALSTNERWAAEVKAAVDRYKASGYGQG